MKIEDMRIGEFYTLPWKNGIVKCVALSMEIHGHSIPCAAYVDDNDNYNWHECEFYKRVTNKDLAIDINDKYAQPNKRQL